jgi:RNA-directed DNA polymerase
MLIEILNPVIRGWANYHQHAVASEAFSRVDFEVWRRLWLWAKRRHPNKSSNWVRKRYFHTLGSRQWVFAVETSKRNAKGQPIWKSLARAEATKIRRHIKIRKDANPYDPQWQPYFKERAFRKKFGISREQAGIKPS